MSRCRFVADHQAAYPVARLCRLAGLARSTFYGWQSRPSSPREIGNRELLEQIREIHEASRGTYGRIRVLGQLERRGCHANHKRVARLMRGNGIRGIGGPGSKARRRPGKHTAPAPDLLNRDFTAQAPNERWVADITEFQTLEGKLYVAGVLDLYAGRLVGWSMHQRRTAELVVDALVMAIRRRRPAPGVIHHADHGSQGGFKWSLQHLDPGGVGWGRCGSGSGRFSCIGGRCRRRGGRRWRGVPIGSGSGRRSGEG